MYCTKIYFVYFKNNGIPTIAKKGWSLADNPSQMGIRKDSTTAMTKPNYRNISQTMRDLATIISLLVYTDSNVTPTSADPTNAKP